MMKNMSLIAIFSIKVTVKVKRSLTLLLFESILSAEYKFRNSLDPDIIEKVKVDNRQTEKQTGQKQYASDLTLEGHKNACISY